ncbi:hypothetical protein JQ582_05480 [Bradyrhizobium japonicum]|jgi:hypothetical protein|uniref:Uncharacterized protein n=1 Tax=Bradyrhizobium japonicum TaxID=375 RepID=A0ABV2S3B2_BRAJP|nr:hypothetical protein [Bradyrhizobium japonicum]MBR0743362.1 hypothetical protein [Bradyrhizobium japonicum]MCD9105406.1 hypothetical protein [Bradyrhizobium japonicum]MCD9253257.1 hypothetical protein [Bradyrhizobium japonicum SEMIA 5079]MCD9818052.1 hypothetical protein [Bradyrhizobium japonicum]MCD9891034.1 hypothetical protein [Bradyrhizobium japonicum]
MVNQIAPPGGLLAVSAFIPLADRKSNVAGMPLTPKLPVSIAAQRRNLARSLLEWRLHGSRTLGNMDRSAPPNNQK